MQQVYDRAANKEVSGEEVNSHMILITNRLLLRTEERDPMIKMEWAEYQKDNDNHLMSQISHCLP